MDTSGKLIWAKHSEIKGSQIRISGNKILIVYSLKKTNVLADTEVKDNEPISLVPKDLGTCEGMNCDISS